MVVPTRGHALLPADTQQTFRDRTLARLVDHVRTLIAVDAVTFVTVDEVRSVIERSAGWFADDILRDALGAPATRPLDRGPRHLVDVTLDRERPLLLPRVDAWEAAPELLDAAVESLGADRALRVWESYRGASVMACPLRTEIGRALGVLVVASLDPERPLTRADLRTAEVIADLAAMALERARLLEAEGRRGQEELRLKRAGEAVASSLELEDVYGHIVEKAVEVTGAAKALLTRFDARAGELRSVASLDFPDGPAAARRGLEVAHARRPIRAGSLMHVPIELGPRLYGVLSVDHEEPQRLGEEDLDLLARFARSSAAAIANAIDFERERRIARALTLGFVPGSLPELPGYETGLLYVPALGEPTGGDVYGAWGLPGGEVAVLVGDVAGKGVENAALSSMVRFFVEARSWDARSPSEVLAQANAMLLSRLPSDSFVTAFLGVLSPDGLRYCNAGHLPPLHVSAAGVRALAGHGLPLGIEAEPGYHEGHLHLDHGDLVLAYTDGLTEARRDGEIFGARRLAHLVRRLAATLGPQGLVRTVHEEVAGWADGLSDDAVALALRRR